MSALADRIVISCGEDGTSPGARFDALLALLSIWWVVGLYLDGRGHLAGGHWQFFTPEHAVLYTGSVEILSDRHERVLNSISANYDAVTSSPPNSS